MSAAPWSGFERPGLTPAAALSQGRRDARALGRHLQSRAFSVGLVTCLYDTGFESLEAQVRERVLQLSATLGPVSGLSWRLLIVDDSPRRDQRERILEGFAQAGMRAASVGSGQCEAVSLPGERHGDLKGRAIRYGLARLREQGSCDALAYINLNRKVHLGQLPSLLLPLFADASVPDVVIGTRAPGEGGAVVGAGFAGRLKSIGYNALVSALMPPLAPFSDTNAPLKVMRPAVVDHLLCVARVEDVSFDTEWMLAFLEGGFRVCKVPLVWVQERGSRPPWQSIPRVLASVFAQHRRWRRGAFRRRGASMD